MEGYPFVAEIQVRWRDLDPYGHVNHAAVASYLEVARVELWRGWFGEQGLDDAGLVVVGLQIDYRRQISLYDRVVAGVRVAEVRGATFRFGYRLEVAGELAATAVTRHACVRQGTGRPTRIPGELRRLLERHLVEPAVP